MTSTRPTAIRSTTLFQRMRWLDGSPLFPRIEPYRRRLFSRFFDEREHDGRLRFNLALSGRGKKNNKSLDLCLAELIAVMEESASGSQCYLLANDQAQASDDLSLLKKLIAANGFLGDWLKVKKNIIERRDGGGFIEVLPAQDVAGSHGKTYRLCGFDEIHGYRTWDLLEAMQFDPTRPEAQMWITSYASLFHKPGVPLYDLCAMGRAGTDPRMVFSWYAADYTTDQDFANASSELRANPSMASWSDGAGYLEQQRRRLPSHKYRRLHLNLPGLPEGSAFQPEPIADAIPRGVLIRPPVRGLRYSAFVDMSGGSSDDAVLAIGHRDADERAVLDRVVNQGQLPPFDPNKAVKRFADVLAEYGVGAITADRYAGLTFQKQFEELGFRFSVADKTKSQLFEALEPRLNGGRVVLLDVPLLEQQLLGLAWKGGRIEKPAGEHDDFANAAAGVIHQLTSGVDDTRTREIARWCLSVGTDDASPWRDAPLASGGLRLD